MPNLRIVIKQTCTYCNGTGFRGGAVCDQCEGTGCFKKISYTLPECFCQASEIYNIIEGAEYMALNADQKDFLRVLLSCGNIDLRTDSQMRNVLFTLFPLGSLTGNRIQLVIDDFSTTC